MTRRPRCDHPGAWFHVTNRGLARRPVFETERDVRYFLSRLAYAVRRGELEVHVFCVMTTHFHLLVRSPTGKLSEAMRRIQNEYVRYFNRSRRRDGPLFRGRFVSRAVRSLAYRHILVRYIDDNPVAAGMARAPWEYAHGSAIRFASGRIPRWLSREWILGSATMPTRDVDYVTRWGRRVGADERALVEARTLREGGPEDPLDALIGAPPPRVRDWMTRKALLADGTRPSTACVPPGTVVEVLETLQARGRRWLYRTPSGQRRDAWGVAAVGLLRHLAGQAGQEVAARLGISASLVTRRMRAHAALLSEPAYAIRLGRVAMLCLRAAFPSDPRKVQNRS